MRLAAMWMQKMTLGDFRFQGFSKRLMGSTQSNIQFKVNKVFNTCYSAGLDSLVPIEQPYPQLFIYFD